MLFIAVGGTVGYILICTFLTLTTRWFAIEFHTQHPLLHWLPTRIYRVIYQTLGYYGFFAEQAKLNLMTQANLNCATAGLTGWRFGVDSAPPWAQKQLDPGSASVTAVVACSGAGAPMWSSILRFHLRGRSLRHPNLRECILKRARSSPEELASWDHTERVTYLD
jgi:hypothetical protein